MKPAAAIVMIERDAQGNVALRDANGTVRILAKVPPEICEILDDEKLPLVGETQSQEPAASSEVNEAVNYIAASMAPEPLQPFARMGINALLSRAKAFGDWRGATRARGSRAARGVR